MTSSAPELFDRLADRFDQVLPFFAAFGARLVDLLAPAPGTRVLDVGAGRGAIAAAAEARGCAVTAVDAAPRMVALLAEALPGVDARVMDAHRLDLPPGSYDLVTGGFVIHLVADRARVLAEMRRVLRPGARVALTVPAPCEDGGRWDGWNRLVGRFAARAAPGKAAPRDLEVASHLRAAGFTDVRAVEMAVHLPVADPRTCWDFHMSHGFARIVEALAPADQADFRREALAELTRMRDAGGIVVDRGAVAWTATAPAGTPS
jgi:SAM-dependent methyltransferase